MVRKVAHANVREELRAAALAQRDAVRTGLVRVLGATRADELALAQDASDDRALAAGLDHLADVTDRVRVDGSAAEKAQLERRRMSVARGEAPGHGRVIARCDGRGARSADDRAGDTARARSARRLRCSYCSTRSSGRCRRPIVPTRRSSSRTVRRWRVATARGPAARGKGRVGKAPAVKSEPNAKPE